MLFLIHFEVTPETRDEALKRLKASGLGEVPGVKQIAGPWFSVTQLGG